MSDTTFDKSKATIKIALNLNADSFYLYILQDEKYLKDSYFFNVNVLIESENSKISLVYQEIDNYAEILSYNESEHSLQFQAIFRFEEVVYIKNISSKNEKSFITLYTEKIGTRNNLFCGADEDFDLMEQELELMSDFSNLLTALKDT